MAALEPSTPPQKDCYRVFTGTLGLSDDLLQDIEGALIGIRLRWSRLDGYKLEFSS